MFIFDIVVLFLLGSCFGSFSSVLIERWKSGKGGIMLGRSECPTCERTLGASELIPIFSYLIQWGKCKKCKNPIGIFYPILEIIMGLVFILSGWIGFSFGYDYTDLMWWIFIVWGFITTVYIVYDFRYMEIPDQILVPGIYGSLLLLVIGFIGLDFQIFFDIPTYDTFHTSEVSSFYMMFKDHVSAAVILYSFLFLQILIPGGIYLLRNKKHHDFLSLLASYFLFPFTLLYSFFSKETIHDEESELPTWVGGGDLRIALFIGLTLGTIHGVASFFFAYILGSIYGCIALIWQRTHMKGAQHTKLNTQIPFGPFLGIGWFLSLLFYSDVLLYVTGQ